MSNGQKAASVNAVLIALVGILIGFIGGYWIGQSRTPTGTTAGLTTATQGTVACPHSLDAKDMDIIAGFRCPGSDDAQVLLSDCHCAVSHGIHDLVKAELAAGKTHEEIRQMLLAQYGDRLSLKGQ